MTAVGGDLKRGWCPGALRPMESGDGLLVRIKPSCGLLTIEQAARIASLASEHGNGLIELTSRGNLQLRGVRDGTLQPLTAALANLRLLDDTPEAEAIRNIVSTPLAGLDPTARDTRAVTERLETELRAHAAEFSTLSDKFSFVVDGGGTLPLSDVEADIRFGWTGKNFAVALARDSGSDGIGSCSESDVPGIAIALVRIVCGAGVPRMRDLPTAARHDAAKTLGLHRTAPQRGQPPSATVPIAGCLRPLNAPPEAGPVIAGIGLPYGGAAASVLQQWLAAARDAGVTELRLTPWRAILAPVPNRLAAERLLQSALTLGFITTPDDPRRAIAACPGAPACINGSTPVRADADRLAAAAAPLLSAGAVLHVSGCRKGCARRQPAAVTFVADAGYYGLVVNGTANSTPCGRFTAQEAAETLARLASAVTKAGYDDGRTDATAIETALREIGAA